MIVRFSRVRLELRHSFGHQLRMSLFPEAFGNLEWIDPPRFPPRGFIAGPMQLTVTAAAERDCRPLRMSLASGGPADLLLPFRATS